MVDEVIAEGAIAPDSLVAELEDRDSLAQPLITRTATKTKVINRQPDQRSRAYRGDKRRRRDIVLFSKR
ncbi:MAG: hypothetical protein EA367_03225 [Leptolyngbya sp. DLM2.Bin15]|nr:MAG: hypothetical protein EA367_03225 [Leptolyngbya sp. DLM2.Bin15]